MVNLDLPKLNNFNDFDLSSKDRFLPFFDFSNKKIPKFTDSLGKITIIPNKTSSNSDVNKTSSLKVDKGLSIGSPINITKREFHSYAARYRVLNSQLSVAEEEGKSETTILTYLNEVNFPH